MTGSISRLRVDAPSSTSLWAPDEAFPFQGPALQDSVEEYLENHTRLAGGAARVEVTFHFADSPLDAPSQERFVGDYRAFFGTKFHTVDLERAVNRHEGLVSLYIGVATSIAALALAVGLTLAFNVHSIDVYFVLIVLVWVLMWDSIEKLVFDSMFIRMRARALAKLRDAQVRFEP